MRYALILIFMAGCASQSHEYSDEEIFNMNGTGTPYTITINRANLGFDKVQQVSEAHCQKYGKHAIMVDAGGTTSYVHYNCIKGD